MTKENENEKKEKPTVERTMYLLTQRQSFVQQVPAFNYYSEFV